MSHPAGYITENERYSLIRLIGRFVAKAQTVWVFCHENPDGDTLGCSLATYAALTALGKQVQCFTPNEVPRMYKFLPHAEHLQLVDELPADLPEVVLALDNAAFDRLGPVYSRQLTERGIGPKATVKAKDTIFINIDHHLGNMQYADYNLVDPSCCACGELLYYAFKQLGLPLGKDVAINLYATILTDTGKFSYANTTSRTFMIASELINLGVNPYRVVNRVYNTRSPGQIKLLAEVLDTIEEFPEDRYFTCFVTQDMLRATGSSVSDTEGALDIMKTVGDYECCFLLKEEADGSVKLSARAIHNMDMRAFAGRFGGGGHPAAAGFRIDAPIAEAREILHRELHAFLAETMVPADGHPPSSAEIATT